jgi:hypothetical protein
MGTDSEDTDPSSPGALRPPQPTGRASATARVLDEPPPGQPTTDPGLGPTTAPPPASTRRPMAVTVPAPSVRPRGPNAITPPEMSPIPPPMTPTPSSIKDSVELLLEGMAGPRPERRKTTPQSDGEASAAYHAEHGVPRARTSQPAGPKVVVPAVGALVPERPGAPAPAKTPARSRESVSTFVPARVLLRRAAMAIVAGALFVLLSFMALRLTGRSDVAVSAPAAETPSAPAEPTALPPAEPTASPVEPPALTVAESAAAIVPVATGGATVPASTPAPPEATPAAAAHGNDSRAAGSHAATSATPRRHHAEADPAHTHVSAEAPATGVASDLGEFKSKF